MIFQIIGLIFLLFFLGGLVFVFSGPKLLPDNVQAIIDDAMQLPIPNLTPGKTGFALNGKRKFYYEARPAVGPQKGTVLLIMGHSSTMMLFPEHFINPICEAGYQVIRYDNRGTGQSDWVKDWNRKNAYDLEDMVGDGLAVLDANGVQQAHVVGVSMGGMIAQSMAIHYGDRVKTLTSIMSSGYMMDPEIKAVNPAYQKELVRRILRYMLIGGPKNTMRLSFCILHILRGEATYPLGFKETALRIRFETEQGRKYNKSVGLQHTTAINRSGSRLEALSKLETPTLVIHGRKDPLVYPAHAEKYASLLPNGRMHWIEDMGHDLNAANTGEMVREILGHVER